MSSPDLGPLSLAWLPTYGEILGAVAVTMTVANTLAGYIHTIRAKAKLEAISEAQGARVSEVSKAVEVVSDALSEHKLLVAQRYVAFEMLERVETRLFSAISEVTAAIREMSARLDRNMDRGK